MARPRGDKLAIEFIEFLRENGFVVEPFPIEGSLVVSVEPLDLALAYNLGRVVSSHSAFVRRSEDPFEEFLTSFQGQFYWPTIVWPKEYE